MAYGESRGGVSGMRVDIDTESGFCFGVVTAISKAEDVLGTDGHLYCLGDIVHNGEEVDRLAGCGLEVIDHEAMARLHDTKVLLRAHGEPPSTYELAERNSITIVDATCPVVLRLQERIRNAWRENPAAQIVIYGKAGHAEVNGLVGQTNGEAIVVEGENDLARIDWNRDVLLFSQTTMSLDGFEHLKECCLAMKGEDCRFVATDTICRQVANRSVKMQGFAAAHDVVIFVGGEKSSNAKALFAACRSINERSYFVSSPVGFREEWVTDAASVGVCGATSTPKWQMEQIKTLIENLTKKNI